jgi:hypothetical protein
VGKEKDFFLFCFRLKRNETEGAESHFLKAGRADFTGNSRN